MSPNRALVWFRSDLRTLDHPALYQASQQCEQVVGIYLLFPEQWQAQHDSQNKLYFWMQNLKALETSLSELNIPLVVASVKHYQEATEKLLMFSKKLSCSSLWFNDEYGVYEQRRDNDVAESFNHSGHPCNRFHQQTLFQPGSIRNKQGDFFKVFTPFKKQLFQQLELNQLEPLSAPRPQKPFKLEPFDKIQYETLFTPTALDIDRRWPAGEQAALTALDQFMEQRVEDYQDKRDFPAIDGTSSLSPWLTAGTLSLRQCIHSAYHTNNGELDTGNKGLTVWISELIWREFYKHILVGFPRVSRNQAFKPETEQLPWQTSQQHLLAWQQGRTGYPLVDAAMKQLTTTGWMHNRLRMVTAMFLSKNLMLDWRLGEQFFMEHLIDGDLAANNGGWQWSASTGTDAAPYFRMFNPTSQSEKFDPEGAFIRQWIPELEHLDNKHIHAPYRNHAQLELITLNYPAPIVDHDATRRRVLSAFKALS